MPIICDQCRSEFQPAPDIRLRESSNDLKSVTALFAYSGRSAQAVKRLKYERSTVLGDAMSRIMVKEWSSKETRLDWIVVAVPISRQRLRERGFNQSELLSMGFSGYKRGVMKRTRHTRPQASLNASERLSNLKGAFESNSEVKGKKVLLVDDVVTTGGTAIECARVLKNVGAAEVHLITFCGEKFG